VQVHGLQPGDMVVPIQGAQGTWRSGGVFEAAAWHKVPAQLPLAAAATLCIK
jgi:NADPH:quinone reductase-like Zn-dependent oxidoreductase